MDNRRLAVLGNPVAHSRSPEIHRDFARQTGVDLDYEKILVPDGRFHDVAMDFLGAGGVGFNITLPCKGEAFDMAEHRSVSANRSRAVNTIAAEASGRIYGDNTDGAGLVQDLTHNLGWKIADQRVLVLGAGGAVRGVLWDLLQAAPCYIHLHNRTSAKAIQVAAQMADGRITAVEMSDLEQGYDLIINGTSAGLSGNVPELPENILGHHSHCYDMVYGAGATAFNEWCLSTSRCEVADGLGMLVEQAALSFRLWFSEAVQTRELIMSLRKTT
ncbi:MAG: shikimate dehydrogenase [Gammaproteobacteria bacterium]|nr:shikimate dehydrogenase [Gammaproteobacteria bacterium]